MTQDDIVEMARQAGSTHKPSLGVYQFFADELEAFAKLVAAKEREACLKICEAQAQTNYWEGADVCAEDIRARGETTLRGEA